jgi:molybdopterin/thiamine biosynthesis adenylyltransferase
MPPRNERFMRNIGIMSESQLEDIQNTGVAIAGLGMGGSIFINLVRLGFRRFHIADPDIYERTNINRQRLAREDTLGRRKDECLADEARSIFPEAEVRTFPEGVTAENVGEFLTGMQWAVDVIDIFAMPAKLALHREARRRGIPVVAGACLGFGASMVVFAEGSPPYESCSGISEDQDQQLNIERFIRFIAPEVPAYMRSHLGRAAAGKTHVPFVVPGIEVAGAFIAAEISKHVLGLGHCIVAPAGLYIDPVRAQATQFEASYQAREFWTEDRT